MMPLSEICFLAIVLYLLYRFVFNFLLPVVRTTRQVRQQFRNMQGPQGGGQGPFGGQSPFASDEQRPQSFASNERRSQSPRPDRSKPPAEDYIDFEEVK